MISYKGGEGASKEEAIIIRGVGDEMEGVDAEYGWLEEKYGEQNIIWELNDQELMDEGDKQYDILRIKFQRGDSREFCFDISEFYGK